MAIAGDFDHSLIVITWYAGRLYRTALDEDRIPMIAELLTNHIHRLHDEHQRENATSGYLCERSVVTVWVCVSVGV